MSYDVADDEYDNNSEEKCFIRKPANSQVLANGKTFESRIAKMQNVISVERSVVSLLKSGVDMNISSTGETESLVSLGRLLTADTSVSNNCSYIC